MRKIKLISLIMSILSSLIICSIGFSTWYEFEPPVTSKTGNYEAYDVLTIENVDMEVFQFSALSFKTAEYTNGALSSFSDTDTGVITVKYKIPAASVNAADGKFTINVSLGYDGAADGHALFGNAFPDTGTSNYYTVKLDGTVINADIDANDNISFTKSLSGISKTEDYEFTVTYEFYIPSANMNFRNTFGKYITGSDGDGTPTKFSASAYVTTG